jgi:hypothetical protein
MPLGKENFTLLHQLKGLGAAIVLDDFGIRPNRAGQRLNRPDETRAAARR